MSETKICCCPNQLKIESFVRHSGDNKLRTIEDLNRLLDYECGRNLTEYWGKLGEQIDAFLADNGVQVNSNQVNINTTDRSLMAHQIAKDIRRMAHKLFDFDKHSYPQTTKDRINTLLEYADEWAKGVKEQESHGKAPGEKSFSNVIQYEDPARLLERLHQLIDGKSGADVGCVLLKAMQENYLTRKPSQKEFESEFELIGSWQAIDNYMYDSNTNALDRANRIVIFD